jgi:hypothetical protein
MVNILNKTYTVLVFSVMFVSCAGTQQIKNETSIPRTEIVQFGRDTQYAIKIDIPPYWKASRGKGTPVPGTERTYDLKLIPLSDEKALLTITIGKTKTGDVFTKQQFESLVNGRVSVLLPYAVEEMASYTELQINNGYGIYCILTDASLVNKTPDSDEFIYLGVYFANYNNGHIVYATVLVDDINSTSFQNMLKSLSSIEPLF